MFTPNFFPQSEMAMDRFSDLTPMLDVASEPHSQSRHSSPELLQLIKEEMEITRSLPPRALSQQEALECRKKCTKCHAFYTEQNPAACYLHPGTFKPPTTRGGILAGWSCCRDPDGANASAYQYTSKGCTYAAFHTEDLLYTNTILRFRYDPEAMKRHEEMLSKAQALQQPQGPVASSSVKQPSPLAVATGDPDELQQVTVTDADTFEGLALRHGTTVSEVKRINRIAVPAEMHLRGSVFVPRKADAAPVAAPAPSATHRFMLQTRASAPEAQYYVEQSAGNLEQALALWGEDLQWEQSQTKSGLPV